MAGQGTAPRLRRTLGESRAGRPRTNVRHRTRKNTARQDTPRATCPTRLTTGPGGSLVLPFWHRTLAGRLDAARTGRKWNSDVHAKRSAGVFQFVFDGREKKRLRIETWGERDRRLSPPRDSKKSAISEKRTASVALLACLLGPRPRGAVEIYTRGRHAALEKMGPCPDGERTAASRPFSSQIKAVTLRSDFLRIRDWDGHPPAVFDAERSTPGWNSTTAAWWFGSVTTLDRRHGHGRRRRTGREHPPRRRGCGGVLKRRAVGEPPRDHAQRARDGTILRGPISAASRTAGRC